MAYRTETEIEEERLFIFTLLKRGGRELNATDAWKVLNEKRAAAARSYALAVGKTVEEAEAAAASSGLTVQTVRRDVRIVLERMRQGAVAAAAVWIDDQITECRMDIESTYLFDELALADLERSRTRRSVHTRMAPQGETIEVLGQVDRLEENLAGRSDLYATLRGNIDTRIKLRTEMRLLRFGRVWFPEVTDERRTLSEALMKVDGPDKAREVAIAMYAREIQSLSRAEELQLGPGDPQLIAMERLRIQRQQARVVQLREVIKLTEPADPGNRHEIVVTRRRADGQIPPA